MQCARSTGNHRERGIILETAYGAAIPLAFTLDAAAVDEGTKKGPSSQPWGTWPNLNGLALSAESQFSRGDFLSCQSDIEHLWSL
jgi:hypothetical protein